MIHWATDYAKCEGWININADQAIHVVCKGVWGAGVNNVIADMRATAQAHEQWAMSSEAGAEEAATCTVFAAQIRAWMSALAEPERSVAVDPVLQRGTEGLRASDPSPSPSSSSLVGPPARLKELLAQLHDAVQRLQVYQMEGDIDGTPFAYVLVRRHEVHRIIEAVLSSSPASKE